MVAFTTKTLLRRQRSKAWVCLILALTMSFTSAAVSAKRHKMQTTGSAAIDALVDKFRKAQPMNEAAVEAVIGKRLVQTSSNASFAMFEAKNIAVGGHKLTLVDYRMPISASATAGPLLHLVVAGPCLKKRDVQAKYGPLSVTNTPTGRSTNEELALSRPEAWGMISFGFAERNPDCLSSITFAVNGRGER
jgi:hypothetical protein